MTSQVGVPAPVVLLHGWGGSYATTWRGSRIEEALRAAGRTVLEIDLPGHGQRPVSHDPADYEFLADRLAEELPARGVLDAIGFSLGGKLLLELATQQPGRLRRLAVGGVGANIFRAEAGAEVAQALLHGPASDAPQAIRSVVADALASGNDPAGLAAVIRRPPRPISRAALAGIRSKVLLVVGADDRIAEDPEPLMRAVPAARTVVVAGLDHTATPSSTEFAALAVDFVLADN
ncbi:alpha/beta fold hydrolase [Nocardia aurea]|uniref:alpha/beta fold hydrolase n=1 Tax=Nocardia aurea TaxID=2144174 RepID=UPI0013004030|nr:alpha/beta fold hydrolase [Nocardia aurea]